LPLSLPDAVLTVSDAMGITWPLLRYEL
jgi:hypothetical protein